MFTLRYCGFLYLLSLMWAHPKFVSGWSFSPAVQRTTTVKNGRIRTTSSIPFSHKWKRGDLVYPQSKSCLFQDYTDNDSDDFGQDSEYYDDFADFDFVLGDDSVAPSNDETEFGQNSQSDDPSSPMSVLQQRFQKLALTEQVNRQQITENWKEGFWGVWGCSLDPYTEDDAQTKTSVTCIRLLQTDDYNDSAVLIVGRSDGSICWLQMETLSSQSSPLSSSADNDPKNSVENRSITTYFENKLMAKPTDDGGMVVDKALQRRENDGDFGNFDEGANTEGPSQRLPFDILAQIQTGDKPQAGWESLAAIVDMLPLPSVKMLLTISQSNPNAIEGWSLIPDSKTGCLLPKTPLDSSVVDIETIHNSPIVGMKQIPASDDDDQDDSETAFVVSVSDNGQVLVWEMSAIVDNSPPSIRIKLDANLLEQEEDYGEIDSVLSIDVDDKYLYLGTQAGKILIFNLSETMKEKTESNDAGPLRSLPLVKSFQAFTSSNPAVSTLLAAGAGSLGGTNNDSKSNRPPTKSLIAGDMSGGLKQWELIPAGEGRLEYWPRLATQKLPGGKPHVYQTRNYSFENFGEGFSPAIRELLCIQQVLLAATDHDLTVWDSSTGEVLYDMQGLDFALDLYQRPSLIAANGSILITNGMENFVCVHDFTMDRITSENVDDYLERDESGNNDDDDANSNGSTSDW